MSRNYSSTAVDTTLTGAMTDSATSMTVAATTGFPSPPFVLAVDAGASTQELVLVTAVASLTLTVTRGYDSTVAVAHDPGAIVQHVHAGSDFRDSRTHEAATVAHGATGAVVGTTNTQTLTNKTFSLASNTLTGTITEFNAALSGADFQTTSSWTAYTPTLSGFTVDADSWFRYRDDGQTVTVAGSVVLATATAAFGVAVPTGLSPYMESRASTPKRAVGDWAARDVSTGTRYEGTAIASSSLIEFAIDSKTTAGAEGGESATTPFGWAAGDELSFTVTYEKA